MTSTPERNFPRGLKGFRPSSGGGSPARAQALRERGVRVRPSLSQAKRLLASPHPCPRLSSLAPTPGASGAELIVGTLLCPDSGLEHSQAGSSWSGHLPSYLLQTSRKSNRPSIPVPQLCSAPALISSLACPRPLFSKAQATSGSAQLFLLPDPSIPPHAPRTLTSQTCIGGAVTEFLF